MARRHVMMRKCIERGPKQKLIANSSSVPSMLYEFHVKSRYPDRRHNQFMIYIINTNELKKIN